MIQFIELELIDVGWLHQGSSKKPNHHTYSGYTNADSIIFVEEETETGGTLIHTQPTGYKYISPLPVAEFIAKYGRGK